MVDVEKDVCVDVAATEALIEAGAVAETVEALTAALDGDVALEDELDVALADGCTLVCAFDDALNAFGTLTAALDVTGTLAAALDAAGALAGTPDEEEMLMEELLGVLAEEADVVK